MFSVLNLKTLSRKEQKLFHPIHSYIFGEDIFSVGQDVIRRVIPSIDNTSVIKITVIFFCLRVKTNKIKKERYLLRQGNTIYRFSIKVVLCFLMYRTRDIIATETNK